MNKNALWRQVQRNLLPIDYTGGWLAGVVMLALSGWLSWLYALPFWFVIVNAAANLVYGTFSFSISRQARRSVTLIATLAFANIAWGVCCFLTAYFVSGIASIYGLAHLIFEGLYVGGLGWLEWKERHNLCTPS